MRRFLLVLIAVASAVPVRAQNELRQVPDPDPEKERQALHIAEGFEVELFASEPMIEKPIQMNWDEQGRLWVVSSTLYPQLQPGQPPNDKIFVLEDTDGDGRADLSTVFADRLLMPTGMVPGDGGVYVANATEILHLKDTDGDGRADTRRVVLSGFGTADTHHLIHTFRWGPDGKLYFNQSIYIFSHVETPWGVRRLEGGGIWALEPDSLRLDVYARGFVNPWGLQFDRWGQSFATDGAGGEGINHVFPGAAFVTARDVDRILTGLNPGHPKLSGLEILSGRHLPPSWDGSLVSNDFRANRVNRFVLEESGSGYVSKQVEDLVWTDHVAFRPVDVTVGPDGAIYLADWYNPIIQHGEVDFRDPRRDHRHGRIWRITAKGRPLVEPPTLAGADVPALLEALKLPEAWTRDQARRLLKERGPAEVLPVLRAWTRTLDRRAPGAEHHLLEALWVSQALGAVDEALLRELLRADDHRARAAAVRVLLDWHERVPEADRLLAAAAADEHPRVRREAVTALAARHHAGSARTALTVLDRPMDEYLDYALWLTVRELAPAWLPRLAEDPGALGDTRKTVYALKSVEAPEAVERLVAFYREGTVPEEYLEDVLDVLAEHGDEVALGLVFERALADATPVEAQERLLGVLERAGRDRGARPQGDLGRIRPLFGAEVQGVRLAAARLAGYWKLEALRADLQALAEAPDQDKAVREAAVASLARLGGSDSEAALIAMAGPDRPVELRLTAAAALPALDVEEGARVAVAVLQDVPPGTDASEVFRSFYRREAEGVRALTAVLEAERIPAEVAQAGMRAVGSALPRTLRETDVAAALEAVLKASGGTLPPPRMPTQLNSYQRERLILDVKAAADPVRGEEIYRRPSLLCTTCHAIGGAGGAVGPDLSSIGASAPADYLVESLLEPDKAVKDGYALVQVVQKDGNTVMGMRVRETSNELVLRTASGDEVAIPNRQIERMDILPGSLMPPGLAAQLEREEFIHLVGFLTQLGEPGDFSVPKNRFVRRWRVLGEGEETAARLQRQGLDYVARSDEGLAWQPAYSDVRGALPPASLPVLSLGPDEEYSVAWFEVDVVRPGRLTLRFNDAAGVSLWLDGRPVREVRAETVVDVPEKGVRRLTVALDRRRRGALPLQVELLEAQTKPAQAELVLGK